MWFLGIHIQSVMKLGVEKKKKGQGGIAKRAKMIDVYMYGWSIKSE
jgi:hypothetical protein